MRRAAHVLPLVLVLSFSLQGCSLLWSGGDGVQRHHLSLADTRCPARLDPGERVTLAMALRAGDADWEFGHDEASTGVLEAWVGSGPVGGDVSDTTDVVGYLAQGHAFSVEFSVTGETLARWGDDPLRLQLRWAVGPDEHARSVLGVEPGDVTQTWAYLSAPCWYEPDGAGRTLTSAGPAGPADATDGGESWAAVGEDAWCPLFDPAAVAALLDFPVIDRSVTEPGGGTTPGQRSCSGVVDVRGTTLEVVATPVGEVVTVGGLDPLASFRETLAHAGVTPQDVAYLGSPGVFGDDEGAVPTLTLDGVDTTDDGVHRAQVAFAHEGWFVVVRLAFDDEPGAEDEDRRREVTLAVAYEVLAGI